MLSPYLTWTLLFFILPTVILWLIFWRQLWQYWPIFLFAAFIASTVGLAWDAYAVANNIWSWPEQCCSLPRLPGEIPTEEIIWAISVALYVTSVLIVFRHVTMIRGKTKGGS